MVKTIWGAAAAMTLALSITPAAFGQTTVSTNSLGTAYVGGQVGLGIISNNGGTNLNLGVTGGYRVTPEWTGAVFFNYIPMGGIVGVPNSSQRFFLFGVEGDYYLTQWFENLSVGAKLGLANYSVSAGTVAVGTTTAGDRTNLMVGPKIAYDYPIQGGLSVGAEAAFMFVTGDNSLNIFSLLGAVKYWF